MRSVPASWGYKPNSKTRHDEAGPSRMRIRDTYQLPKQADAKHNHGIHLAKVGRKSRIYSPRLREKPSYKRADITSREEMGKFK
jgi:hypothetical protein